MYIVLRTLHYVVHNLGVPRFLFCRIRMYSKEPLWGMAWLGFWLLLAILTRSERYPKTRKKFSKKKGGRVRNKISFGLFQCKCHVLKQIRAKHWNAACLHYQFDNSRNRPICYFLIWHHSLILKKWKMIISCITAVNRPIITHRGQSLIHAILKTISNASFRWGL